MALPRTRRAALPAVVKRSVRLHNLLDKPSARRALVKYTNEIPRMSLTTLRASIMPEMGRPAVDLLMSPVITASTRTRGASEHLHLLGGGVLAIEDHEESFSVRRA